MESIVKRLAEVERRSLDGTYGGRRFDIFIGVLEEGFL